MEAVEAYVAWTLDTVNPSWRSERRRGRGEDDTRLYEWQRALGRLLAELVQCLPEAAWRATLLTPILDQPDDVAMSMVAPFTRSLSASGVLDAPNIKPSVLLALHDVVDRVIEHHDLDRARGRDGRISGLDLPELLKDLFFVAVERADGATRFANGDWRDFPEVLPIVDKLVRQGAWVPYVATLFVRLCERAAANYPAEVFADDVLAQLQDGQLPEGWKGTGIPAGLAALVQAHADRQHPLPTELARKLLHVLDALVDLGDRRSAALQQSESFRGVRLA